MLNISVTITNDHAIDQLAHLKTLLNNFQPEYQAVGNWWVDFLKGEVFDSQGQVYGRGWARLSPAYAQYKASRWGGAGILIASGALRAGWNMYITADYLTVKNEAVSAQGDYYGAFHQDGTKYMPARPLLKVDAGRSTTIKDLIVNSINKRITNL